jgi:hypothetical protein
VIYSNFLLSGMADFAENFRLKMAVFLVNSTDARLKDRVRFNKNRDFNDFGNGESE